MMNNVSGPRGGADPKLAACLVLCELADKAPWWVHLRMDQIIPNITAAVHDHRESVRQRS